MQKIKVGDVVIFGRSGQMIETTVVYISESSSSLFAFSDTEYSLLNLTVILESNIIYVNGKQYNW